jgi:hypothetical protein
MKLIADRDITIGAEGPVDLGLAKYCGVAGGQSASVISILTKV